MPSLFPETGPPQGQGQSLPHPPSQPIHSHPAHLASGRREAEDATFGNGLLPEDPLRCLLSPGREAGAFLNSFPFPEVRTASDPFHEPASQAGSS